jgi:hypothetical protein
LETTIRYRAPRRLDGQEQSVRLKLAFPTFRQIARGNPYVWEGTVRPIGGAAYQIRIKYLHGRRPVVEVVEPALVTREPAVPIPHTFHSGAICLHLIGEWNSSMYIHETIVPWTSLWLYYYEMWHATGEWLGGGHVAKPKDGDQSARLEEEGAAQ